MAKSLATHVSYYTLANVLVTLAGVVSFPILTRLLTVEEYGVMNLVATALAILVGVAKLGVGNAALRFYSEVKAGKHGVDMNGYASTVIFGMGATGLAVTLVWAGAALLVPAAWWNDDRVGPLMSFTSLLVLVRVLDSALLNQMRAQEDSRGITYYSVIRRYFGLAVLLGTLFFISRDLWGFFVATVLAEALATAGLAWWLTRRVTVRPRLYSAPLFKAMLAFGIPMAGYELASQVLSMGDRYVIQRVLGAQPLGTYAAAYNLCDYVRAIFLASFTAAVLPMYARIWEEQGREATVAFLESFLRNYVLVAALLVAGLSAVGGEVLAFLASEKYRAGDVVVPFVIAGMAMDGLVMVAGAGLYVDKRSKTILGLVAITAVLNIVLNVAWVARWGIVGSAVATLVSYAVLLALSMWAGRRRLPIRMPIGALAKFGAIGVLAYAAASTIHLSHDVTTLIARSFTVAGLYTGLSLALDHGARTTVSDLRRRALAALR
jgi:O-antigen/teichoic acid export membrane protein